MKKIILSMISATMLIACADNADNGVSAPREICYDKKLTYKDVSSPEYKDYAAEWYEKACVSLTEECTYWDYDYILIVRECLENVETH